jgi:hypothetical protein
MKKMNKILLLVSAGMLLASCGERQLSSRSTPSVDSSTPSLTSEESSPDITEESTSEDSDDSETTSETTSEATSEDTSEGTSEATTEATSEDTSVGTSEAIVSPYSVSVGANTYNLADVTEQTDLLPKQTGAFEASVDSVSKGDVIVFSKDGSPITEHIGGDKEDAQNKNNLVTDKESGAFSIHNDAANVKVYFKTWEDGGHSFWITGYEKGEDPDVTLSEIYFTNNKGWSNVYAYLWDDESKNADWPGVKLENPETNDYGEPVYKVEVGAFKNVIFSDGNGTQTVDISLADVADKTGFYPDGDKNAEGKYPVGSYQHN